jgi:hypothetical protein
VSCPYDWFERDEECNMLGRLTIVGVLALLGLVVGVVVHSNAPRSYIVGEDFVLSGHGKAAIRLAAVARSQHVHAVRVSVLNGGGLRVVGHGTRSGAARAFVAVAAQVRKAIYRMPGVKLRGVLPFGGPAGRPQGSAFRTGAVGLLAGLGIGPGIVVPPGDA